MLDSSQTMKHASEDVLQFDTESVSKKSAGQSVQTAHYVDLKFLGPPKDDDATRHQSEQATDDHALTPVESAKASALESVGPRAGEKVDGIDLECGRRIDDPVSLIKRIGLCDKHAQNLVDSFHCTTGQVLDAGLGEDLSY